MTRGTPILLLSLLAGGIAVFSLNALLPVPAETFVALAGVIVFTAGMLYGVIASARAAWILLHPDPEGEQGVAAPMLTIVVTAAAWWAVTSAAVMAHRSLQQREKLEQERLREESARPPPGPDPAARLPLTDEERAYYRDPTRGKGLYDAGAPAGGN